MADFVKVAQVGDVPENSIKSVDAGGTEVALFNLGGEYYALADICPHAHCNLSEGDVEENDVICPCHGATFNIKSGEVTGPPARENATSYPVQLQGDDILVAV